MLRNIPNKIDQVRLRSVLLCQGIPADIRNQPMLKQIVDETSVGKYDFMYLRIGKWSFCV